MPDLVAESRSYENGGGRRCHVCTWLVTKDDAFRQSLAEAIDDPTVNISALHKALTVNHGLDIGISGFGGHVRRQKGNGCADPR